MPLVVIATPADPSANSFLTLAEANDYFLSRIPIEEWDDFGNKNILIVMATRLITSQFSPSRKLIQVRPPGESYYVQRPTWTGTPTTTTQRLPWPRVGMYDRNGNAIGDMIVPQDLKEATAELAGHLAKSDRLLDNDVAVQGITSVKAGSVSVGFKSDGIDVIKAIPDIVAAMLYLTSGGASFVTGETLPVSAGFALRI